MVTIYYEVIYFIYLILDYPLATPTSAGLTILSCNLYPIFDTTTIVPDSLPSTS